MRGESFVRFSEVENLDLLHGFGSEYCVMYIRIITHELAKYLGKELLERAPSERSARSVIWIE